MYFQMKEKNYPFVEEFFRLLYSNNWKGEKENVRYYKITTDWFVYIMYATMANKLLSSYGKIAQMICIQCICNELSLQSYCKTDIS